MRRVVLALSVIGLLGPTCALADPEAFDPLLDQPPGRQDPTDRLEAADMRNPGFRVSGHAGIYGGRVSSRLTEDESGLRPSTRAEVGFGFGVRTRSLIEIGLDLGLGLGQTWDAEHDQTVFAFDLLIEPRILAHVLEGDRWALYAGVGGLAVLFDLEPAGLNQAGIGPDGILGLRRQLDAHSAFYLEGSACAFYDALAFHYEDRSEEELARNPTLQPKKVTGSWYAVYRGVLGYRLTF